MIVFLGLGSGGEEFEVIHQLDDVLALFTGCSQTGDASHCIAFRLVDVCSLSQIKRVFNSLFRDIEAVAFDHSHVIIQQDVNGFVSGLIAPNQIPVCEAFTACIAVPAVATTTIIVATATAVIAIITGGAIKAHA